MIHSSTCRRATVLLQGVHRCQALRRTLQARGRWRRLFRLDHLHPFEAAISTCLHISAQGMQSCSTYGFRAVQQKPQSAS